MDGVCGCKALMDTWWTVPSTLSRQWETGCKTGVVNRCIELHWSCLHYTSYNRHMPVQERTWLAIVRSRLAQHLSRFADIRSIPPFTPRYAVQFNAARVDSLPVEAHDRGWAVYPSDLYLPVNFSFGAERCWTCGNQGCSVRWRVGLKGLGLYMVVSHWIRPGSVVQRNCLCLERCPFQAFRSGPGDWKGPPTSQIAPSFLDVVNPNASAGPGVFSNPASITPNAMGW